jgi:hypothetical protein
LKPGQFALFSYVPQCRWDELISPVPTWLHLSYKTVSQSFERWAVSEHPSGWGPSCDHIAQFSWTATTLHIAPIPRSPNWAFRHPEFSSLLRCLPRQALACILPLQLADTSSSLKENHPHCLLTRKFAHPSSQTWTVLTLICSKRL